jgi:hypothetical protein
LLALSLAIGPSIGGLLVGWFNWRAAFLINIPAACAALVMALAWIAKDIDQIDGKPARDVLARIDVIDVAGFGSAMTALLVFLLSTPHPEWIDLGVFAALGVALIWRELKASNLFLGVRLLASHMVLTRTYHPSGVTPLGTYVVLYGLTQRIETARGLSVYQAGLVLIPMGVLSAIAARVLSRRLAVRMPLIASALFLLAGAVGNLLPDNHSDDRVSLRDSRSGGGRILALNLLGSVARRRSRSLIQSHVQRWSAGEAAQRMVGHSVCWAARTR